MYNLVEMKALSRRRHLLGSFLGHHLIYLLKGTSYPLQDDQCIAHGGLVIERIQERFHPVARTNDVNQFVLDVVRRPHNFAIGVAGPLFKGVQQCFVGFSSLCSIFRAFSRLFLYFYFFRSFLHLRYYFFGFSFIIPIRLLIFLFFFTDIKI